MIRVQERDREILRVIYEQQFARPQELIGGPFKKVHKSEAYRRIRELEAAGLLDRKQYVPGGMTFLRLTPRGVEMAKSESRWELRYDRRIRLDQVIHQWHLTAARLCLEELWDGTWVPEPILRREFKGELRAGSAVGDGAMLFASGQQIVVEVEVVPRNRDVYLRLFQNWSESPLKPGLVLFVTAGEPAYHKVRGLLKYAPAHKPFAVIRLEELLQDPPPKPWSIRGELSILERRTF